MSVRSPEFISACRYSKSRRRDGAQASVLLQRAMFAFLTRIGARCCALPSTLAPRGRLRSRPAPLTDGAKPQVPDTGPTAEHDRLILVWLYRAFPPLLNAITVVKPETVLGWHRRGFRAYWNWKSRRHGGRPRIDRENRRHHPSDGAGTIRCGERRDSRRTVMLGIRSPSHRRKIHD